MRNLIVACVAAVALVVAGEPAAAADRQCGVVSGVFLGDLPSGGTVSIDGRKFLVGGVGPRNVDLSAAGQLSIGSRACAEGEFRVMADGSVDLYNGRVFPNIAGLPSTTTVSSEPVTPWLALLLAVALIIGSLTFAPHFARR